MYITPDYIYTIGMCTLLVQNMSTEVLIIYTTTGKIFCSLVNKCMPKLGYISEQPVKKLPVKKTQKQLFVKVHNNNCVWCTGRQD